MKATFWERDYGTATDTCDWPAMPYEIWVVEPGDSTDTSTDMTAKEIMDDILERYADAWSALADM